MESLACGVPVITTAWGGQTDFVTQSNGWLVDYKLLPAEIGDAPVFDGAFWADPSVDHLRQCLRESFADNSLRELKAQQAASSVSHYKQEAITDIVMAQFNRIESEFRSVLVPGNSSHACNQLLTPQSRIMLTSPHRRCGIRENTQRLMDAGLNTHMTLLSCPDLFRNFTFESDVVHIQYHPAYVNGDDLSRFSPRSNLLVATVHELYGFDKIAYLFDIVFVHSMRDRDSVASFDLKNNARIEIIPLGCCEPAADRFIRSNRTQPVIGFHGFTGSYKGILELIEAFALFQAALPEAKLVLFTTLNAYNATGGQQYLVQCQSLAAQKGLEGQIRWETNFDSADVIIERLSAETDIIVLPYLPSGDIGSSGAARIAMAAAKPVIVSDTPMFSDLRDEVLKYSLDQPGSLPTLLRAVWANFSLQSWVVDAALRRVRSEKYDTISTAHLSAYARHK